MHTYRYLSVDQRFQPVNQTAHLVTASGYGPAAHAALVHVAVQSAGVYEPACQGINVRVTRQAPDNLKEIVVAFVAPAPLLGSSFDPVGGGAPENFRAQQRVLLRDGVIRQIEEVQRRRYMVPGSH